MNKINVYLETGKKRTFASALDWPGWLRSGKGEEITLQSLIDYGPRYAKVLQMRQFDLLMPTDVSDLTVVERLAGDVTTDFGAPAAILSSDREPIDDQDFERFKSILGACWQAFDNAVESATSKELRKGARGGGRDLEKILDHVLEADRAYLSRLAWKFKRDESVDLSEELGRIRGAILEALEAATRGELPEKGPRGGIIWPPRYFVRRVAWHILDHAWEIEDRIR